MRRSVGRAPSRFPCVGRRFTAYFAARVPLGAAALVVGGLATSSGAWGAEPLPAQPEKFPAAPSWSAFAIDGTSVRQLPHSALVERRPVEYGPFVSREACEQAIDEARRGAHKFTSFVCVPDDSIDVWGTLP